MTSMPPVATNAAAAVLAATMQVLEKHHPAVRVATVRSAAVHWFDEQLLGALADVPEPDSTAESAEAVELVPPDLLFAAMESLPFMEVFGPGRTALHAQVRQVLFHELRRRDDGVLRDSIKAAASELRVRYESNRDFDADELAEYIFTLLAADSTTDDERVDLLESVFGHDIPLATAERALLWVDELDGEGMLSRVVTRRLPLWRIRLALAAGTFDRALELGGAATSAARAASDEPLVDEIGYELAVARSCTGDRVGAQRLAEGIAGRSTDPRVLAQCRSLLGDLASSAQIAEVWYVEALHALGEHNGLDPNRSDIAAAQSWGVGELGEEDRAAEPDGVEPRRVAVLLLDPGGETGQLAEPDAMFAELWLRLGDVHKRQGVLANAGIWFERAEELFSYLGQGDGRRRAILQQQDLAGRLGSRDALRGSLEQHRVTFDWAKDTGAVQIALETLIDIADTYWRLDDIEAAEDTIREALGQAELAEEHEIAARANELLADVLVTAGRFEESDGPRACARAWYEPDRPVDVVRLDIADGSRWENAGFPDRASDAYQHALEGARAADEADLQVWSLLGLAKSAIARRDLTSAEQHLDEASLLSGDVDPVVNMEVQVQRLNLYATQGRKGDADAIADSLVRESERIGTRPMVARVQFEQASSASQRGGHVEAIALARSALELARDLDDMTLVFDLLTLLAFELYGEDELREARAFAEEGLALARQHGSPSWTQSALRTLGDVLVELGELESAIKAYHQALALRPQDAGIMNNLGWAHLRAGEFDTSLNWSYRALEADPHDPFPYRNIGHALLGMGRKQEAKEAYLQVIRNRLGDETFDNTFREFDRLHHRLPEYADIDDVVAWFRDRLDADAPE